MKLPKLLCILIVSVLMLASCQPEADENITDPVNKAVFDASSLNREDRIPVTSDSIITINNMDPMKLYAVRHENISGSRTVGPDGNTSESVVKIGDSHLPVPGKDNSSEFKAAEVGIRDTGYVSIIELKNDPSLDFTVLENEDYLSYLTDDQFPVYEQYWHVDADGLTKLGITDPSKVIIGIDEWGSGSGSTNWGYVTIDNGYVNKGHNVAYYDFSGLDFINLYCAMTVIESSHPWGTRLILCNPQDMEVGKNLNPRHITDWFTFDPTDKEGKKYVVEINIQQSADKNAPTIHLTNNFNLMNSEGKNYPTLARLEQSGTRTVLYIGEISEELILELQFYNNEAHGVMPDNAASVTLREASEKEIEDYENNHVMKINGDSFTKKFNGPGSNTGEMDISIMNEGKDPLQQWTVEVQLRNGDGSWYEGEYTRMTCKTLHSYGYGYSSNSTEGPYIKFRYGEKDILDMLKFRGIPENVSIIINAWKDATNSRDEHHIYTIHGPELTDIEDFTFTGRKYTYTVPTFEKEGTLPEKILAGGEYVEAGDKMDCYGLSKCVMPIYSDKAPASIVPGTKFHVGPKETELDLEITDLSEDYVLVVEKNQGDDWFDSSLVARDAKTEKASIGMLLSFDKDRNIYYFEDLPYRSKLTFTNSGKNNQLEFRAATSEEMMKHSQQKLMNTTGEFTLTEEMIGTNTEALSIPFKIEFELPQAFTVNGSFTPDSDRASFMDVTFLTIGTDGISTGSQTYRLNNNKLETKEFNGDMKIHNFVIEIWDPKPGTFSISFDQIK